MMTSSYDDFLRLLPRIPNEEQFDAIRTEKNSVIAAGAGSGKTQVLAYRFAWLVLTGRAKADEILTLTFTNKAAAEMYQRIYQTLVFFAENENLSPDKRRTARESLKDFANAHIKTLDSYCAEILRQCANRYGIRPDFAVDSADGERNIKTECFKFLLNHADNPAVQAFAESGQLQDFAEDTLAGIILKNTSLAAEDGYFTKNFIRQKKIITECWNYMLGTVSRPDVNFGPASGDIRSIPVRIAALEESVRNLNGKKTAAGEAIEKLCRLASETDFSTLMTEDLKTVTESQLENLEQIFKAASGYQNRLEAAKEATTAFRDNIPYYRSVMSFIKYITPLEGLYALLDELLKEINSQKRITGSLSFKDAGEMALKVLLENEDIRNQEKRAYKKIMIDEFQDNNGKNRDLLYILALKDGEFEDKGKCVISAGEDGSLVSAIIEKNSSGKIINDRREEGKLFFVGDEKQSIYKFRGADVSVFNELTASGENSILAMNCNFRSTPFLLSAFNRIFAGGQGIFLNGDTGKADYEAYYERPALKYGLERLPELNASNIPLHACFVNSNFLKNAEDSDRYIPAKEQSAYNMARKISSLAEKGASWSDFAILDKSRTDRKIITKYLNMFNIPYSLDENRDIFQEAIVNDFYSFLRLCVYPSDVNSYAAYLCSPLAGLNEKDVELILSIMIPDDDPDFVFNAEEYTFPERIKTALSEDKFNKFLKAIDFYRENAHKVLRQKITLTLTELWHKKGYKYESFLDPNLNLLSEQFDMLFELSRSADENQKSVSWFIDELNKLKSVFTSADSDLSTSDITYPVEQDSAVSIMTIHKSKGLQFRHVFIWGCTDVTAKTTSKHYSDEKTGFAFTTPDGENFFKLRTKNLALLMETAEYRRLIYVAVTRAEEDAWITGIWNPEAKESKSAFRLFENLAMKYYSPAFKEDPSVRKNKIYFTEGAPFDFEDVHCITYDEIAGSLAHNDLDETRAEKIESAQEKYAQAEELSFNCSAVPHKTPSGLEDDDSAIERMRIASAQETQDFSLTTVNFSAADFGTLAHAYLENMVRGTEPENWNPEERYFKNLSETEIKREKELCIKFTRSFMNSSCGRELEECRKDGRFFRPEWKFKMFHEGAVFTGSIDLIYELDDGTYRIIDYKSDTEVDVTKYTGQQNCYRTAAAKLLEISEDKIDCQLYFMRHDRFEKVER